VLLRLVSLPALQVLPKNEMIGFAVSRSGIEFAPDVKLLAIMRGDHAFVPSPEEVIQLGDVYVLHLLRCGGHVPLSGPL
jgi:hypothetical protein